MSPTVIPYQLFLLWGTCIPFCWVFICKGLFRLSGSYSMPLPWLQDAISPLWEFFSLSSIILTQAVDWCPCKSLSLEFPQIRTTRCCGISVTTRSWWLRRSQRARAERAVGIQPDAPAARAVIPAALAFQSAHPCCPPPYDLTNHLNLCLYVQIFMKSWSTADWLEKLFSPPTILKYLLHFYFFCISCARPKQSSIYWKFEGTQLMFSIKIIFRSYSVCAS